MWVSRLRLCDFRSYETAEIRFGTGLTLIHGRNGAGKTNLVEALYFGCTGRSCRTANEREVVRFGAAVTRIEVDLVDGAEQHALTVGFQPGEPKRFTADGAPIERLIDAPCRPLLGVFLPDRLELVKGAPGLRRAHVDQVVAAVWPTRAATRRSYGQALAQRNALLARVRSGRAERDTLRAWDRELAVHGIALRDNRAEAAELLTEPYARHAGALGLDGEATLRYRPRTRASSPDELAAELADRTEADLLRGLTGHGPHRDDLVLERDGRELRAYGSQGEQRLALLSLLLAEREVLGTTRSEPLLLLDDVMSELDPERRALLAERLQSGGQTVITATDVGHVPGAGGPGVELVAVTAAGVVAEAVPT